MLFLGGYVNRGDHQLHVICLLLMLKARYPDLYFLLRGHDEWSGLNGRIADRGSFAYACKEGFGPENVALAWNMFNDVFAHIPLAAVVDETIFCAYGGLPLTFNSLPDFEHACRRQTRPIVCETPAACRLVSCDEEEADGRAGDEVRSKLSVDAVRRVVRFKTAPHSPAFARGMWFFPSQDALRQVLHNNRLNMVVRARPRPTLEGYTMLPHSQSPLVVSLTPSETGKGVVLKVDAGRPLVAGMLPSALVEIPSLPNPVIPFLRDLDLRM
jgi:Calcineurin-like phosphoesterase